MAREQFQSLTLLPVDAHTYSNRIVTICEASLHNNGASMVYSDIKVTNLVIVMSPNISLTLFNMMASTAGDVCSVGLRTIMILGIPILLTDT